MIVHWNSWLAKRILIKRLDAITFGKHVFIKYDRLHYSSENRINLLAHEDKHVKQYKKYGFFGFLFRYVFLWIKHGYQNHPFEVEARGILL